MLKIESWITWLFGTWDVGQVYYHHGVPSQPSGDCKVRTLFSPSLRWSSMRFSPLDHVLMPSWSQCPHSISEMGIDRLHRWGHVGSSTKMYEFHVVRKLNLILWGYMSIPNLKVTLWISWRYRSTTRNTLASPSHICPPVTPRAQAKAQQWSYMSSYQALTDTCLQDFHSKIERWWVQ